MREQLVREQSVEGEKSNDENAVCECVELTMGEWGSIQ